MSISGDPNPYATPVLMSTTPAPFPPLEPEPPRVWTVFVVYVLAIVAVLASQIIGVAVLVVGLLQQGIAREQLQPELMKLLFQPATILILGSGSQLVIGLAGFLPACFSSEPLTQRLRLGVPNVPMWSYAVFALGSIVPFAIGLLAALGLHAIYPADDSTEQLYKNMTWQWAIPFVLFIAFAPGIFEELLFRGYMQSRLLRVWPAWLAIGVTSVLFGIIHMNPHQGLFAAVVGVWLGVLAWRTGSIWPSVVCHAFINGAWNILNIGARLAGMHDLPWWALAALGTLGLGCFAVSLAILAECEPLPDVEPAGEPQSEIVVESLVIP